MSRLDDLYKMRAFIAGEIATAEAELTIVEQRTATDSGNILSTVADLYCVTVEEVLTNRSDRATKARMAACWLLRGRGLSFPHVGRIVGRDHTTVMYACRQIDNDPAIRALLWPLLRAVAA